MADDPKKLKYVDEDDPGQMYLDALRILGRVLAFLFISAVGSALILLIVRIWREIASYV